MSVPSHYAAAMSMLTPPGLGGKYRITGNKYPRMRRSRRRGKITLAVVCSLAMAGLLGWGSLQLIDVFTGGDKASAAGPENCATPSGTPSQPAGGSGRGTSPNGKTIKELPEPKKITVNVLNATTQTGLAKKTAEKLEKRGFKIGEIGNATPKYDKKIKGVGVLLGSKDAASTVLPVLGTQVTGAEQQTDSRKDTKVDLILGDGFKDLASPTAAAKALDILAHPAPPPKKHC